MVEFALVSIVAFFLLFTAANMSLIVLGNSVGSNAARDGARVGIINYVNAHDPSSANYALIKAAVEKRLANNVTNVLLTVTCRPGDSLSTTELCTTSAVDLNRNDVIEVKVTWTHKGFSPFGGSTSHSATARMTIGGEPDLSGTTPTTAPPPGPMVSSIAYNVPSTSPTTTTADVSWKVTFSEAVANVDDTDFTTASGGGMTGAISVVSVSGGPTIYTVTAHSGDAASSGTLQLNVIDDGTINNTAGTAQLGGPGPGNGGLSGTSAIYTFNRAPASVALSTLTSWDDNANGKVDHVRATFTGTLAGASCNSGWSLPVVPAGASISGTPDVSGSTVTLTLTEGAVDTSVSNLKVRYSSSGCNASGFGTPTPLTPTDQAPPRVMAITSGSGNGYIDDGDTLVVTFSEPVSGFTGTATVMETDPNPTESLTISGFTNGPLATGDDYIGNNKTVTFASSSVVASGSTITVTVGGGCTGDCGHRNPGTAASFTFVPNSGLKDAAGLAVANSLTLSLRLF
jgi:Flp pilus assembly protein TadG